MARPPLKADVSQRMMNMSFAMLAAVGVIAYFIYSGNIEPDEPIKLTVTSEQVVTAPGQPIGLDVAVRLENNSKKGIALTAPTQCDTFRWFLTGTNKEFVESQNDDQVCAQVTVTRYLESAHAMNEKFRIALDPARVHPGDYLLFVRYWGNEATVPVTVK